MFRLNFSIPSPLSGSAIRDLLAFAFQTTLLSYLGFFLLENLKPGFVVEYLDLDWWLAATILTGLATAIWPHIVPETRISRRLSWRDYFWSGLLGFVTMAVMWYKLESLKNIGLLIAVVSGVVVVGLSVLVWTDRDESKQ